MGLLNSPHEWLHTACTRFVVCCVCRSRTRLFPSATDAEKPISYDTQHRLMKDMLGACDVFIKKICNAPRSSGALECEAAG